MSNISSDFLRDFNYRFRRNENHHEAMKYLTEFYFKDYRSIMMLSALIGYENNKYVEFSTAASDRVLMMFFTEDDQNIIDLLGYAHSRDQNVLMSRKKYEIFESYYNGGFPILLSKMGIDLDNNEINQKTVVLRIYETLSLYNITEEEYLI